MRKVFQLIDSKWINQKLHVGIKIKILSTQTENQKYFKIVKSVNILERIRKCCLIEVFPISKSTPAIITDSIWHFYHSSLSEHFHFRKSVLNYKRRKKFWMMQAVVINVLRPNSGHLLFYHWKSLWEFLILKSNCNRVIRFSENNHWIETLKKW